MKKLISLILCLSMLLVSFASAQEQPAALPEWIELSADDTVLTVRIPLEDANAHACRFIISDESILEMLTCEVVGDEPGEADEGEAMWAGSFMGTFEKAGHVFVQLGVYDEENALLSVRMIHLFIVEDNSIQVVSFEENSPFWLDEDLCGLNISLYANPTTGFNWKHTLSNEEVLTLVSEEYISAPTDQPLCGSGGQWTARFEPTGAAGFADVHLICARTGAEDAPADEMTIHLFINEAGALQLIHPQPFDSAPVGLYEAEDGSTLAIYRRQDGAFTVDISVIRLTAQEDGLGEYENELLTVAATDAAGNPMTWEITRTETGLRAVVAASTWELLPEGTEFEFLPAE